jgi:hypothetical protein
MLLLVCMFGCKGAGTLLKVAGAVAVTTVRVAALAAAASSHNHHAEAGSGSGVASAQTDDEQRRADAATNAPGQCTELFVETIPAPAPGTTVPRAADCGGNMLIQDSEGHWRRYGKDGTPALEEP